MKIADKISYISGKSQVELFSSGAHSAIIKLSNCEIARIGGVKCNNFSEANGVAGKLRGHLTSDGILGEAESVKIIPFGAEYQVGRNFALAGQILKITCDVDCALRGHLHSLELDPIEFPGKWTGGWVYDGEKIHKLRLDSEVMYQSSLPPLLFRLTAEDGNVVEYASGADYWRHLGVNGNFRLINVGDGISFVRTIFQLAPEEAQPERKNWRFKYLLSWKAPVRAKKTDKDIPLLPLPEADGSCLSSPALQRLVKKIIRQSTVSLAIGEVDPQLCFDAAHQERPGKGKLPHFPLEDMVVLYWWGNRFLERESQGATFAWRLAKQSPFKGGAFESNLVMAPGILEKKEER